MNNQLYCPDEGRKALVRAAAADPEAPHVNGIDYLEVLDDEAPAGSPPQRTLLLHCFLPVVGLDERNVRIEGGVRVRGIEVLWARPADTVSTPLVNAAEASYLALLPDRDRVLVVRTDQRGDFSTYTLWLALSPTQPDEPPAGFDRILSSVPFSFKVECPSDFDCKVEQVCPPVSLPSPQIGYMAKDYASFRGLMLDRLAVTLPDWQERNQADLGVALVELLAYAGDHLSYYQDAVATEGYLGTARLRTSVRRHARLVDYFMHDGANARAWVCLEVGADAEGEVLPARTPLLSRELDATTTLLPQDVPEAVSKGAVVFETLHPLTLREARNAVSFYTWGDRNCCLPRGATQATLDSPAADLDLHKGDVLIFEEVLCAETGLPVDANLANRHVVRLVEEPVEVVDLLNGRPVVNVRWHDEDALPMPLCLKLFFREGRLQTASVARANVLLADHGRTISDEEVTPARVANPRRYRPHLQRSGLTQAWPYDDRVARASASNALIPSAWATTRLDLQTVQPAVALSGDGGVWRPARDLLGSDRFAEQFVVEIETDGRPYIRFGDNVLGRQPSAGARFTADYRVGNGRGGNVGPEALTRVVTSNPALQKGIQVVRNPLSAIGGTDPEETEQVRLYAPQAFRRLERAVTEEDYGTITERHAEVQKATGTRRWTGSWHTMFVTVDRKGGRSVDTPFEDALRDYLERYRMAGYDLEVESPIFVPLDIVLSVCVKTGYFRANVKQALLETFSNRVLPDGQRGFFHPDNFTFGQPVYLSQVIATAMRVPGVDWIDADDSEGKPNRFQRWGQPSRGELGDGRITFGRLEIARLDNDPSLPENGKLEFFMRGGL